MVFYMFVSLTQVSLHVLLVGDSVNEKLVDTRHNTQDLPQSDTRNTRHHCSGPSSQRTTWHNITEISSNAFGSSILQTCFDL